MRQNDRKCLELCSYQANIFSASLLKLDCSSKIFLRRFFLSSFAFSLDYFEKRTFSYDVDECFEALDNQYGPTSYGSEKLSESVLHYLGYITRYICYTRDVTTRFVYRVIGIDRYYVLHTQSEEYAIRELLEINGLTEDIFDANKQLKIYLKKQIKKQLAKS